MSRPLALIVLCFLAWSGLSAPLSAASSHALHLNLPVGWQLTRTRLLVPGASTVTETFRETWVLEVTPSGLLNLSSPRAKVPVFGGDSPNVATSPHRLILSDVDFARLIGLAPALGTEAEDGDLSGITATPVILHLGRSARGGTDVTLSGTDEEHITVHLEIGSNIVL